MRTLRVWWPRSPSPGNLGDVLTPRLLAYLGYRAKWVDPRRADVLATGSIIRFARKGQTIYGSGLMRRSDSPHPGARYVAVRGPLTAARVRALGGPSVAVHGDPALLLPHVVNGEVSKRHDVGLVPHYVDAGRVKKLHPDERVINVLRSDPLDVVREIRECRAIASSSLHGIIVAHAFGIPAAWVRWSDLLSGDGTKFCDYAASVGVELTPHESLADAEPVLGSFDSGPLLEAGRSL